MRYRLILLSFLCLVQVGFSQKKESRIKKEDFPETGYSLISEYLTTAKRIRLCKITEGDTKSFRVKLKKGQLHYMVNFDGNGDLVDVAFGIKEYDIPEDSWTAINDYLNSHYPKLRIKNIQQQHPLTEQDPEKTLHEAFQNLMLPHINYEIVFSSKKEQKFQSYEALFDANGNLVIVRKLF